MEIIPRPRADIPEELLDQYLLGRATPEEQRSVEESMRLVSGFAEWVAVVRGAKAPREGMIEVARLRDRIREEAGLSVTSPRAAGVLEERAFPTGEKSPEHEWAVGRMRTLQGVGTQTLRGGTGRIGTRMLRRWIWPVGVVGVAVMAMLVVLRPGTNPSKRGSVYVTGPGQQATLTLSDGTRVSLAPNTQLRVLDFGEHVRSVAVDGEAYFNVARVADAPFVVQSGGVTTRVLGTEFIVQHTAGTPRVHVAVTDGKVRVFSPRIAQAGVTLTAGMIGDIIDSTVHVAEVHELTPQTELVHGKLVFRDTPVSVILQTLSSWYGYQFRCSNPALSEQKVTIGLPLRSSATALAILEDILDVNFTIVGDTVTMMPHPVQPANKMLRIRTYDVWTPTREVGR